MFGLAKAGLKLSPHANSILIQYLYSNLTKPNISWAVQNFKKYFCSWNPLYFLLKSIPIISQRWFLWFWNLESIENGKATELNEKETVGIFWFPLVCMSIPKVTVTIYIVHDCNKIIFAPYLSDQSSSHFGQIQGLFF